MNVICIAQITNTKKVPIRLEKKEKGGTEMNIYAWYMKIINYNNNNDTQFLYSLHVIGPFR